MTGQLITGFSRYSRQEKLEITSRNMADLQAFIKELQFF
jgi:hypothetical protein